MNQENLEKLVQRFQNLFAKDKNYYAMDYGDRFNPKRNKETNKIEYSADENGKRPFWYVDQDLRS